jgi:hypothetical protein
VCLYYETCSQRPHLLAACCVAAGVMRLCPASARVLTRCLVGVLEYKIIMYHGLCVCVIKVSAAVECCCSSPGLLAVGHNRHMPYSTSPVHVAAVHPGVLQLKCTPAELYCSLVAQKGHGHCTMAVVGT